jgi:hypothetical protein
MDLPFLHSKKGVTGKFNRKIFREALPALPVIKVNLISLPSDKEISGDEMFTSP